MDCCVQLKSIYGVADSAAGGLKLSTASTAPLESCKINVMAKKQNMPNFQWSKFTTS